MPRPTPRLLPAALAAGLLAGLLGGALPARAALAVVTSVEELARASDAVVRGVVLRAAPLRAGGRILTEVTVRTTDVWRGGAPAEVVLRVPGGAVDGVGQRVDGAPTFAAGEEVVVFLERSPEPAYRVSGLALGKYRVTGAAASPDLGGVRFLAGEVARGERAVGEMPLAELERRVREAR